MAQIITKYSTTGGLSPSGLTTGELAVNILDKKLYVGGAAGSVSLSDSYVTSFNGVTGAVQGVSAANGLTGAVTWAAGTGLDVSSGGGAITYGIGAGFALLRSVGNTAALDTISNPSIGDLVFVQNPNGTYYYWDYYSAGATYAWINISLISNALQGDLNGDGSVNGADLGVLLANWSSLGSSNQLRIGVADGISGSFRIYAEGEESSLKKGNIVRVSTNGGVSQFLVNANTAVFESVVQINGEGAEIALEVLNGSTHVGNLVVGSGVDVYNGLNIISGGISGGFIDGGTFV